MVDGLSARMGHIPKQSDPVSKRANHRPKVLLPLCPAEKEMGHKTQTPRVDTRPPSGVASRAPAHMQEARDKGLATLPNR